MGDNEFIISAHEKKDGGWPDSVDTSDAALVIVVPREFFNEPQEGQVIEKHGMYIMSMVPVDVMCTVLRLVADGLDEGMSAAYTRFPGRGLQN